MQESGAKPIWRVDRVVGDAASEGPDDPRDVTNVGTRIGIEDHEVSCLPRLDGAELLLLPDHLGRLEHRNKRKTLRPCRCAS
jgi:hypothetical protein